MRPIEKVLVRLDEGLAGALLRVALGYVTGLTWLTLVGLQAHGWTVVPFFLAVLAAVRVVPLLLRAACRFSEPVRSAWTERRQMAKRYDSYQWRKLLWIGLGLMLHVVLSARRSGALVALAVVCLIAGSLGLAAWHATAGGADRGGSAGAQAATTSGEGPATGILTMGSKA